MGIIMPKPKMTSSCSIFRDECRLCVHVHCTLVGSGMLAAIKGHFGPRSWASIAGHHYGAYNSAVSGWNVWAIGP